MANSFAGKVLADGQLGAAKATLYTCPVGTVTYVKFWSLKNTGTNDEDIALYVKRSGGTSRSIGSAVLEGGDFARVVDKDEVIVLSAGDELEGNATNASVVDYVISGTEET